MQIIWVIIIGFVIGVIARFLHPGGDSMGIIMTTVLGVAGSVIATYVGRALGFYAPGESAGLIAGVIGAVILLVIYGIIKRPRRAG